MGTDENQSFLFATLGKGGVLRQEPVARMNGLCPGLPGCINDLTHVEIAFRRTGRSETDSLVGLKNMKGGPVGFGIDGNRLDAHFPAGGDNANDDFAPIGDEYLVKHVISPYILKMPNPVTSSRMGAFSAAEIANPRILRVSAGSMMPSSQMLVVL